MTTLYAPRSHRHRLQICLALQSEFARICHIASEPLIGEIRLSWWRERLQSLWHDGAAASHPLLQALAEIDLPQHLPFDYIEQLVEAYVAQLYEQSAEDASTQLTANTAQGSAVLAEAMGWLLTGRAEPAAQLAGRAYALALTDRQAAEAVLATLPRATDRSLLPVMLHATLARHILAGGLPSSIELQLKYFWAALHNRP